MFKKASDPRIDHWLQQQEQRASAAAARAEAEQAHRMHAENDEQRLVAELEQTVAEFNRLTKDAVAHGLRVDTTFRVDQEDGIGRFPVLYLQLTKPL